MKAKNSLSLLVAAVAMLALGAPVLASDTDDRIEASAKDSYVFKTYLNNDDIEIESEAGAVTLTGMVAEDSHKTLAGETLASLPGVKSVDNKLKVKGDLPVEKSDAWLLTKVKTSLLYHRSVSGLQTEVVVQDGIVTLRGEADNEAQKNLTAEYVADIEGVKTVNNEMTVAKTAKETRTAGDIIDDASITAMAKMTLLYHRSTSGFQTKVETKDGVVLLSGKAGSLAEKDLATQYVKDVNGVKDVKNLMTIE
ncbi:MAG: transport-associated protein [Desulfuromonadaceae bacterium GWC2_58_13]|nr:MAG: transport-associated protein [Desulfuromonadaceae bacterium GWC2_58_13]